MDAQERYRALAIIEKAEREGTNVVETLVSHMVSRSLILELTGEEPAWSKKANRVSREEVIREWVLVNEGSEMTTQQIADGLGMSSSSANKVVKEFLDYFVKVRRGVYLVRDGKTERQVSKKGLDK